MTLDDLGDWFVLHFYLVVVAIFALWFWVWVLRWMLAVRDNLAAQTRLLEKLVARAGAQDEGEEWFRKKGNAP